MQKSNIKPVYPGAPLLAISQGAASKDVKDGQHFGHCTALFCKHDAGAHYDHPLGFGLLCRILPVSAHFSQVVSATGAALIEGLALAVAVVACTPSDKGECNLVDKVACTSLDNSIERTLVDKDDCIWVDKLECTSVDKGGGIVVDKGECTWLDVTECSMCQCEKHAALLQAFS